MSWLSLSDVTDKIIREATERYLANGGTIKYIPKGYHSEYGFFWDSEQEIANDITNKGLFEIGLKNEYNGIKA